MPEKIGTPTTWAFGTGTRPREVWTLVAMVLVGAAVSFIAAFAPISMHRFVGAGVASGLILLVTAVALWLLPSWLSPYHLLVGTLVVVALAGAMVGEARTSVGASLVTFVFVWMTIYAASFLPRRICYMVLGAIACSAAGGLSQSHVAYWPGLWSFLVITTMTTGIVLERSVGQLRRDADTDALTGLLNRRGFQKAFEFERSLSERASIKLALVEIDLDNFKSVNDEQGHAAGDRLLAEATAAWSAQLRSGDLLARFGGDEFVMLLPHVGEDEVEIVLARCRDAHPIAWTAGYADLEPGESVEDCLQRADLRLYAAKLQRRGRELAN